MVLKFLEFSVKRKVYYNDGSRVKKVKIIIGLKYKKVELKVFESDGVIFFDLDDGGVVLKQGKIVNGQVVGKVLEKGLLFLFVRFEI